MHSYFRKPKTLTEVLQEGGEGRTQIERQPSSRAEELAEITPQPGFVRLGTRIKGNRFPPSSGVCQSNGWVTLEERLLDEHLFLIGATGAGKTQTILRLVQEILLSTDRHIYIVDGKGEDKLALALRSLIYQHKRQLAPIFRLGHSRYGAVYDGFRGAPSDIQNRLVALIRIGEAESNALFFADINRVLLHLACHAPNDPLRNFEQLIERVDKDWLMAAYKQRPYQLGLLRRAKPKDIGDFAYRVWALADDFAPCVGHEGFALEETPYAIFSIRTQSVGDTSKRFLKFLIEDLKDFVGKRQRHPGVLIIDEFGQFENDSIVSLLSLARSFRMGVVLATQDLSLLPEPTLSQQILSNCRTKLLMATDYPEEVAKLAGTILRIEASLQHEKGNPTGLGSARIQDAFNIDMNEVAKLEPGEAFLIRQRRKVKLKVRSIEEPPSVPDQEDMRRDPFGEQQADHPSPEVADAAQDPHSPGSENSVDTSARGKPRKKRRPPRL